MDAWLLLDVLACVCFHFHFGGLVLAAASKLAWRLHLLEYNTTFDGNQESQLSRRWIPRRACFCTTSSCEVEIWARLGDERGVASNIVGRSLGYFFYDAGVRLMRKVG